MVTLAPIQETEVEVEDVVLVQWKGNYLLHLVLRIDDDKLLIGNNLGKVNGWVPRSALRGKVVAVAN